MKNMTEQEYRELELQAFFEVYVIGEDRGLARWDRNEDALLKRHYKKYPNKKLAELFGRTQNAIRARASLLRLRKAVDKHHHPTKRVLA